MATEAAPFANETPRTNRQIEGGVILAFVGTTVSAIAFARNGRTLKPCAPTDIYQKTPTA